MRRKTCLTLAIIMLMLTLATAPFNTMALDNQEPQSTTTAVKTAADAPSLTSISFKNAELDSSFSPDIFEYTITLADNTISPMLESYTLDGEANIFVTYDSDDTNHKTGLTATIDYETGSKKYIFKYSNPPQYVITSNNNLSKLYVNCGEVYPELNSNATSYKLYIPSDMTTLQVSPSPEDINAYCIYTQETKLLANQTFVLTIKCVASDGSEKDYTFDVKRSNKTTAEVLAQTEQDGYASLVEGTRFYEKPEFKIAGACILGGILIIIILYYATRRIAINPYDTDEKPFYSSVK